MCSCKFQSLLSCSEWRAIRAGWLYPFYSLFFLMFMILSFPASRHAHDRRLRIIFCVFCYDIYASKNNPSPVSRRNRVRYREATGPLVPASGMFSVLKLTVPPLTMRWSSLPFFLFPPCFFFSWVFCMVYLDCSAVGVIVVVVVLITLVVLVHTWYVKIWYYMWCGLLTGTYICSLWELWKLWRRKMIYYVYRVLCVD